MAQDSKSKKPEPGQAPAKAQEAKAPAKGKEALVYVGPNQAGALSLRQFTVYRGGLPENLRAAIKEDPNLGQLFVPVADLVAARAELRNNGSRLARAHSEAQRKALASRRAK